MRRYFLPEYFPNYLEFISRILNSIRRSCRRGLAGIFVLGVLATYIMISVTVRVNPQRSLSFDEDSSDGDVTPVQRWYLKNASMQDVSSVQQNQVCHLWPKMLPNSDRIENQLLYRPKKKPTKVKLILSTEKGAERPGVGRSFFVKKKCPVTSCKITYDRSKTAEADAVLFKNNAASDIYYGSTRPPNQIWILALLESPYHTPEFTHLYGHINWTATYRLDSELVTPYGKWVVYDPKVLVTPQIIDYASRKSGKKTKVAWFVSNCQTVNKRLEYAQELAKHIDVDIYGSCAALKCSKRGKCGGQLLREEYKFYLSFENSNCKDYITEKLWFALENDALPVVMGPSKADYELVAPHKSFIHIQDFPSPKDLAEYLHRLDANDTEYNQYFQWKGTGEMIDTKFYCRLCALLHADNTKRKVYHDFQEWWAGPQVCSHSPTGDPLRFPEDRDNAE